MRREKTPDPYIGLRLEDYELKEMVGHGRIGRVYRGVRLAPPDELAYKIVPELRLKPGWEREIEKVAQLRGIPGIVQYHRHGSSMGADHRPFTYVVFDFVRGRNLNDYLKELHGPPEVPFIETLLVTCLNVLFACRAEGIYHGDLHAGNILIRDPDRRIRNSPETIWISDFGYGGSHNSVQPKDDLRQLASIIAGLLRKVDEGALGPRDKVMREKMTAFLRIMHDVDPTQGMGAWNPETLLTEFERVKAESEREAAAASPLATLREPGDYLSAETLGYRADEWKELFVPEVLGTTELLSRNVTVLTGARGCGKTMAYRRMTVFMDNLIGAGSGVKGSDEFVGFYFNCRDLAEAFPWLHGGLSESKQQQLMHYFHLGWLTEITRSLRIHPADPQSRYSWFNDFMSEVFGIRYRRPIDGTEILAHVDTFLTKEKERTRLQPLGKHRGLDAWPLARLDFLDVVHSKMCEGLAWVGDRPFFLFLDDYTIPILSREVQRMLNPILFKRRSKLFFKISTEAANSFDTTGISNKPLELNHDFELLDLATECLHQDTSTKNDTLQRVFRPRIDRHSDLQGKNVELRDLLGTSVRSNNELARQMREASEGAGNRRILYHGVNAFVGMWSSDIRIMIQMFTEMLRQANGALKRGEHRIPPEVQDKCFRSQGGEFIGFTELLIDPTRVDQNPSKRDEPYGKHLRDITETFIGMARFELTKGPLVKNEDTDNPKQAFRLEIVDKFELDRQASKYYHGLVRWHVFLQDWRGKSARGMITPRLYLNRVLIPFANLTFSSKDHILLTNAQFNALLDHPKPFLEEYKRHRIAKAEARLSDLPIPGLAQAESPDEVGR